jgi:hypothetical protein
MFYTVHKISRIRWALVVATIRIAAANSAALSCCLPRQATSSLLRMEKRAPRTGFGEMDPALRSNFRVSREMENPLSIFFAKWVHYV